jgi:hypothetical protein
MLLIRRRIPSLELMPIFRTLSRTVAASLLMGLTIAMLPRLLQDRLPLAASIELPIVVGLVVIAGGMVYFVFSFLLQSEELRVLLRLARVRS